MIALACSAWGIGGLFLAGAFFGMWVADVHRNERRGG
jgi:hypothetical protein